MRRYFSSLNPQFYQSVILEKSLEMAGCNCALPNTPDRWDTARLGYVVSIKNIKRIAENDIESAFTDPCCQFIYLLIKSSNADSCESYIPDNNLHAIFYVGILQYTILRGENRY